MSNYRLISTPRWIWLLSLVLCIASGVMYGIFGAVTRIVVAQGITRDGEDVLTVAAQQDGVVGRILVKHDDVIDIGDPIAELDAKEIDAEIARAEVRLQLLKGESADLEAIEATTLKDAETVRDAAIDESNEIIHTAKDLLAQRQALVKQQETLLADGLVAGETLLRSRAAAMALQNTIEAAESTAAEARLGLTRIQNQFAGTRAARRTAITIAESERALLEERRRMKFTIRSEVRGRVADIAVEEGEFVSAGDRVARVAPDVDQASDLRVVAFVPLETGKLAQVGDRVQIAPSFLDVSRYGYMIGRLENIGDYVASPRELALVLDDAFLIDSIVERFGGVLLAEVSIERDPSTPSGYRWSSLRGWKGRIDPGMMMDLNIVYQIDRPIVLFLPWLRSLFGQ
jgi:HlyD family secretion protein